MHFTTESIIYTSILTIYYAVVIKVFANILLDNKHPLKTQSYLLLIVLLPVLGLMIYFYFGVNYRKEKLFTRKKVTDHKIIKQWMKDYEDSLTEGKEFFEELMHEKAKFPVLCFKNENAVFTNNNKVDILQNGENKFPSLLRDIETARDHIHLEYYIINDDYIGTQVIDLLCKKAKARVKVRLIFDPVGSSISKKTMARMKDSGVEVFKYMPVLLTRFANKINYRDHRKIVVVDGNVGYVGGMNIADHYINGLKKKFWRDTHLRIEGEAVTMLQMHFLLNWYFVSGQLVRPSIKIFSPPISVRSGIFMGIMGSSPDSDSQSMMEAYFSMITNARREVLISTPYFIPNESILTAIKTAAKSGVNVTLVLPRRADSFLVNAASLSFVEDIVEHDVKVYLYNKGIIHSKVIIVDECLCTVGSANMDYRSFEQNAEINAFIYNKEIAGQLKKEYMHDIAVSTRVELGWWSKRPFVDRLVGSAARVVAPLL